MRSRSLNLVDDRKESKHLAKKESEIVEMLRGRMNAWIEKRDKETDKKKTILNYTIGTDKHIGSVATAKTRQPR